ncbi:hypothetical protein BN1013_01292 [Candidatus Rubidus massiliensis]|nr:hypothetical protein BN1013_01292 [Candidatus Rubidus massiliensis]
MKKIAFTILYFYLAMFAFTTVIAHMRKSGSTKMDMNKYQLLRTKELSKV